MKIKIMFERMKLLFLEVKVKVRIFLCFFMNDLKKYVKLFFLIVGLLYSLFLELSV